MSSLSVEHITSADISDVVGILNEATGYKIRRGDRSWSEEGWTEDEIGQLMPDRDIFKLLLSGRIVGTFTLAWSDVELWGSQPDDASYLHSLAVGNDYHEQGFGRVAVGWAIQHTLNSGRPYIRLDCEVENTGLRSYYENQGFSFVGSRVIEQWDNYDAAMYQRPTSPLMLG